MHAEVYTNVEMKFGKFNFNIVLIVLCAFDDVEKVLTFAIRDSWYPIGGLSLKPNSKEQQTRRSI